MRTDITGRRLRRVTAIAIASTFLTQNFAWAICSDGTTFPGGNQGFVFGTLQTAAPSLANMTPNVFTATAGSVFVPDNSTFENNDPTQTSTVALNGSGIAGLPITPVGGHNWQFDQGSTTCKATDSGSGTPPLPTIPGQAPAGWQIPPNTTTDCFVLPVVKLQQIPNTNPPQFNVIFQNFGTVPIQSQAIIPTCNPANLSAAPTVVGTVTTFNPNPLNTRLNQLGCSLAQLETGTIQATDQSTAPAYMATASIRGGLFIQELDVTPNTIVGDSGRVISNLRLYGDQVGIPIGTKLTSAMISPDGHFIAATSIRRDPKLYSCNQPLGDPGRIDAPPVSLVQFAISNDPVNSVKCLGQVATTGLQVTLSNVWGADNQPYLGGQRTITTAGTTGGNPGSIISPSAWPQCIVFGKGEPNIVLPAVYPTQLILGTTPATFGTTAAQMYNNVANLDAGIADVYTKHNNGGCGAFGPNSGFSASPVVQPQTLATYEASNGNMYMFTAGVGQPVVQTRMTQDAVLATHYATRTYFSGENGITTGVGVAPDMNFTTAGSVNTAGVATPAVGATGSGSLIVMVDSSGLGLAAQENMTRLPLCEDF
jgi:hypothetical protein